MKYLAVLLLAGLAAWVFYVMNSVGGSGERAADSASAPKHQTAPDTLKLQTPVQISEKARNLQRECNLGDMTSCANLGVLYKHGTGVPHDNSKAYDLYKRACYGGLKSACGYVGDMMYHGLGVAQNKIEGERLLRQGCRDGNKWTCSALKRYGL